MYRIKSHYYRTQEPNAERSGGTIDHMNHLTALTRKSRRQWRTYDALAVKKKGGKSERETFLPRPFGREVLGDRGRIAPEIRGSGTFAAQRARRGRERDMPVERSPSDRTLDACDEACHTLLRTHTVTRARVVPGTGGRDPRSAASSAQRESPTGGKELGTSRGPRYLGGHSSGNTVCENTSALQRFAQRKWRVMKSRVWQRCRHLFSPRLPYRPSAIECITRGRWRAFARARGSICIDTRETCWRIRTEARDWPLPLHPPSSWPVATWKLTLRN